MGNFKSTFQRFISNKNTVTILCVIAGVLVLWGFYNYRVNQAISPVQVPYAKVAITATTEITKDMIGYTEVNSKFLKNANVIKSSSQLIGMYVTTGTSIPAGGLFYTTQVVKKDSLPNSVFDNIPDGYGIFSLKVDLHSTYANSIYPGTRIDLYMKAVDDTGKIMYGKFVESIEVLAVRDSTGKNVFDQNPPSTPAELLFAVPEDMRVLLTKASFISNVTVLPVPRNKTYTAEAGATQYGSDTLKNYVLSKATTLPDETTSTTTTNSSTSSSTKTNQ
jgi:hypothetical protein